MASSSVLLIAGLLGILGGALAALLGVGLIAAMFSGRGVPVSAAGMFLILTLVAGPILLLVGATVVFAGISLIGGYAWARPVLESFGWLVILGAVAWIVSEGTRKPEIEARHVIRAMLFLAACCVPAAALVVLLRSEPVTRALQR